ncbi:creatininase family protein [Flammeovirgaceae bacterium SG7u.111]|nr:creatininase family protein [Flammeovirgaceae bacterium SG7u.132]WPO33442.1 creatininase family protein [Flammeovirgaceae bacterium SG7u.111]
MSAACDGPRPYILAETNWKTVKDTDYTVAILPWGATEAHNYHLPYATDTIQCDYVAAEAAKKAWDQGAKPIVLPTVPFGLNTGQLDVKLCLNMNMSTQLAVLKDLVDVLNRHGIDKLIIMNGHGGNHFKQQIRELSFYYPEIFVCAIDWFKAVDWNKYFEEPGDHAGEMETSCMQLMAPHLTLPLEEAGEGKAKTFRIKAFKEGWASAQRQWTKVTEDTGVGNPGKATPEKARKYVGDVTDKIAELIVELSTADVDDLYE